MWISSPHRCRQSVDCSCLTVAGRPKGRTTTAERPLLDSHVVASEDEIVGESPRLRLRRLRPGDIDDVAAMVADPEQMRFYPAPKSRDEADAWLARNLALYEQHGFGTWCLEALPDHSFAGYCGLRPLALDGRQEIELAWHVEKTHWNRGLATEAALMAARLGFERFGLQRLVAIIHPDNGPSRRVAQKLAMTQERSLAVDGEPVVLYGLRPPRPRPA
ncbi:MAG: GCN5-related N-acetyltransferase [Solirubrobacteraceae bacterium]|nr:GCN5-related N-acetyltransferase [Solirubrobacteraceae bacterium]